MLDTSHSYRLESPLRRHPELILPSIEGGLPNARDQQAVNPHHHQGMNDFTQRHTDNREMLRPRALSVVYLDEEERQTKRRRILDQQPLDDHHPRTVLIPLHYGAEDYQGMTTGPAKAVYYENVPLSALDKRIIPLPPRDARRYEDDQRRIQTITHNRDVENRSVHQMPGEEYQPRYENPEVPAQPQSPKRSLAFQPVYDQQSPILFNASAPSYREVLDQRPAPRHTSGVEKGGARVFSDSYAVRSRPQYYDDVGRDMRANFRNLEVDPQKHHDHEIRSNGDMNNGRPVHAYSQGPGIAYLPRSFQTDSSVLDRERHRQMLVQDNPFESRHVQQQYSLQDRVAGPSEWRVPVNAHLTSRQVEKATTNPFRGHSSASMANSAAVQWSGLRYDSRTFHYANTMMSRNHGT